MSDYKVYRENGGIKILFPNRTSALSIENGKVASVSETTSGSSYIDIINEDGSYLVYKAMYTLFKDKSGASLGSTKAQVISSLENLLTEDLDLGKALKVDTSATKSETTELTHGDTIANGGAVVLSSGDAKIGVQGNHIEFDSSGSYGSIDINVKTPASQSDRAIHIFGTALAQGPNIEFEGPIIISASNGNRYYLKVSNTGNLYTEAV